MDNGRPRFSKCPRSGLDMKRLFIILLFLPCTASAQWWFLQPGYGLITVTRNDTLFKMGWDSLVVQKRINDSLETIPRATSPRGFVMYQRYALFLNANDTGFTGQSHYLRDAGTSTNQIVFSYMMTDTMEVREIGMVLYTPVGTKYADTTITLANVSDIPAGQAIVLEYMPATGYGNGRPAIRVLKKDANSDLVTDLHAAATDWAVLPKRWKSQAEIDGALWVTVKLKYK